MPTYEYECKECGHIFEEFQRITDETLKECPKCKGELRRVIYGGTGIIFKGSGFYCNDYKTSDNLRNKNDTIKDESEDKKDNTNEKTD